MRLIVFFGLFLPVVIAGLSVYTFKINKKILKLLVAFSGAYLISLVFNELVPHIYSSLASTDGVISCVQEASDNHSNSSHHIIGLLILGGFFIQLMLDYLTKGIEHGHSGHDHSGHDHLQGAEHKKNHEETISFIPVLIGLFLHSFLEGMPLADGLSSIDLQNRLLTGIIIHNIPISIVLVSLMIQSGITKRKAIIFLSIFALSAPAGSLLTNILGVQFIGNSDIFICNG